MIQRFIQRVGESPDMEAAPRITVDDLMSTPRSGLLVAEGGMGKSTFLRDFADRVGDKAVLIKLAYFAQNPQGLVSEIERLVDESASDCTVILDGLDEAPDLVGTVCWRCKNLPQTVQVWIASRECRQLATVSGALKKLGRYRLLPFSEDDVRTRAAEEECDVAAVDKRLREHDLWSICGNPMGCDFVLKAFKQSNGQGSWTSQEIWRQGILSLCDDPDSETKPLDKNAGQFSVDQVYACAAWLALNLNLSGKNAVFAGVRETECPSQALPVSALESEGIFPRALIEATLPRGVFLPWGGGRSGFAHTTYSDYLAAEGFRRHIPRSQWESLLLDPENRCLYAQRTGVAQWLMTVDAALANRVFEWSPESFLTYDLARLKRDGLCRALLERAKTVAAVLKTADQRLLQVLKLDATLAALRDFVFSSDAKGNYWATDLAIDIARECEYWDYLVGFVLDGGQDVARRQDAVFALSACPDLDIKRRLRPLLDLLADKDDRWRGALLFACWPEVLSPAEVFPYLAPIRCSDSTSYVFFLSYKFIEPFLERLDVSVVPVALAWAVRQFDALNRRHPFCRLAEIGQILYTTCWKRAAETNDRSHVSLLADGFLAATEKGSVPFYTAQAFRSRQLPDSAWIAPEWYSSRGDLRFAVVQEIVERGSPPVRGGGFWLVPSEFPLVQASKDDLSRLAKILIDDPYQVNAELWVRVIQSFASSFLDHGLDEDLDRLHIVRPDLFLATAYERRKEREAYRLECEEAQRKRQEPFDKIKADRLENQRNAERWIKEWLADDRLAVKKFPIISYYIALNDGGVEDCSGVDMRQSPGWKKLTPDEQDRFVVSAERFLKEGPNPEFSPRTSSLEWHKALILLKACNRAAYDALPETIWRKCAVEVLNFGCSDEQVHYQALLDDLSARFPDVAREAIVRLLSLDDGSFVLSHWGNRLTKEQAEAVWSSRFTPESEVRSGCKCFSEFPATHSHASTRLVCDEILSDLARHQPGVVRQRVNEWLKDGFSIHLGHPFYDVLRRHALRLDADTHISAFLQAAAAHTDWGRRWMEATVETDAWQGGDSFLAAFLARTAEEIGSVYELLDVLFPSAQQPRHESGGSYWRSARDAIYEFKSQLFSGLVNSGMKGSARVVERLCAQTPDGLRGLESETARRNEAAARLPTLSVEEIRELTESRKAVIASAYDLKKLVLSLLNDYQVWLKGKSPAVGDLWNTPKDAYSPKEEGAVSDHLERFLRDRLPQATFANREVQISRKLAEGGERGARTDIWIDCETVCRETVCRETVRLCVEVKCSWNRDAKTAIAGQLVEKYLSPGRADAGVLLLAWFHGAAWKTGGRAVWASRAAAGADLEQQAEDTKTDKPLAVFVLDCTL